MPSTALAGGQHFLQRSRCLPQAWWLPNTWTACAPKCLPLLRAVVSKALSKSFYGQAAAPTFLWKDPSRLFMTARGQCHLEKKPAVLPPMVASIEGSFEARPGRLAPELELHLHCKPVLGGGCVLARHRANGPQLA